MKKLLAIILALVMLLSLAACGAAEEPVVPDTPDVPATEPPVAAPTEAPVEEPADLPNGFIDQAYVDSWYLFGELSFPSLIIYTDGSWEMCSPMNGGQGGDTICEGFSFNDARGGLFLHDPEDMEVGYATLDARGLELVLTSAYEYLYDGYMSGDLVFNRESESMNPEGQPLEEEDDAPENQPLGGGSALLEGEWLYSAQENILNFYGDGSFLWIFPEGETTGTYTFDGEYVTFEYALDGGSDVAWMGPDGCLYLDGVDGEYYYKNEG